jgi:threonine dehydrogenase-like Zn-dependent dehydrogenase
MKAVVYEDVRRVGVREVADAFVTGWHATELAGVAVADSVAVFGAGAIGRTHDRRYTTHLRDLIVSGRARPGRVVTHRGALDDAPGLYRRFDRREDGVVKAVLHA